MPERGDELFAWQERVNGEWGTIAATIPGLGVAAPLVFRNRLHAAKVRDLAVTRGRVTHHPVRLARFTLDEVEVEY